MDGPLGTLVGAYVTDNGSVNIPAIIATAAGIATIITFCAKSIYWVKPQEEGVRLRFNRIVRIRKTIPFREKRKRWFGWFGPVIKDETGRPKMRQSYILWVKRRLRPPKRSQDQLSGDYGEILILGPGVYWALFLFGKIEALNTQDNPESIVEITADMKDGKQRDLKYALLWGVTPSGPGEYHVARAIVRGVNGVRGLIEQPCISALRDLSESDRLSYEELGDSRLILKDVGPRVRVDLAYYGVDLRGVRLLSRPRSLGEMLSGRRRRISEIIAAIFGRTKKRQQDSAAA